MLVKNQRSRRFLEWVLAALLVVLVWLPLSALPLGLPPVVGAVLVALVLFILPGYLLQRVLFPQREWRGLNLLPIAFGLSLGVGALAWGCARILGGSLKTLAYLLGGACTALIAWNAVADHRRSKTQQPASPPDDRQAVWPYLLVLETVLFWTFVAACWGAPFTAEGDDWYYMAIVRRIAQTQTLAPGDPHFMGIADPQRVAPANLHPDAAGGVAAGPSHPRDLRLSPAGRHAGQVRLAGGPIRRATVPGHPGQL